MAALGCGVGIGIAPSAHAGGLPRLEPPCGYDVLYIDGPWINGYPTSLYPAVLNNHGEVAGTFKYLATKYPFTWTLEGGFKPLPRPQGVSEGYFFGINDNGWLIFNASGLPTPDRGFIIPFEARESAAWIEIEPPVSPGRTYVRGINNANEVVGLRTAANLPPGSLLPYSGFQWSPNSGEVVTVAINVLGDPSSGLSAINDLGTVIGWSSPSGEWTSFNSMHAISPNGEITTVPAPHRSSGMMPRDINAHGDAVVIEQVQFGPSIQNVTQYSYVVREGMIACELPVVAPYAWSNGLAINVHGVVVGESRNPYWLGDPNPVGTVWFDGVAYTANELAGIDPTSPDRIHGVMDVNDKGQILGKALIGVRMVLLTPTGIHGDLDCDGVVGPEDLSLCLGAWGQEGTRADLDGSGVVDGADLGLLLSAWAEQSFE